ncbi:hypothetical protein ACFL7D_00795 [candidate division KSB1 bacterium]
MTLEEFIINNMTKYWSTVLSYSEEQRNKDVEEFGEGEERMQATVSYLVAEQIAKGRELEIREKMDFKSETEKQEFLEKIKHKYPKHPVTHQYQGDRIAQVKDVFKEEIEMLKEFFTLVKSGCSTEHAARIVIEKYADKHHKN